MIELTRLCFSRSLAKVKEEEDMLLKTFSSAWVGGGGNKYINIIKWFSEGWRGYLICKVEIGSWSNPDNHGPSSTH